MTDDNATTDNGNALPPLSGEERQRLKTDIEANGIRHPVEVCAQTGVVLDGHHRLEIARELNIDCPTVGIEGLQSVAERTAYQLRVNLARRHLSPDQAAEVRKRQQAAAIELRQAGWTQQQVGDALGVSHQTILKWEGTIVSADNGSLLDLRVKLGKEAKTDVVKRVAAGESHAAVAADYKVTRRHVGNIVAKATRDAAKAAAVKELLSAAPTVPTVTQSAAEDWLDNIKPGSVDLLITDPPYSTDVDDIDTFVAGWLPKALGTLSSRARAYVFIGSYPEEVRSYLNCAASIAMSPTQLLIWHYPDTLGPDPRQGYKTAHQVICYWEQPDANPVAEDRLTDKTTVHKIGMQISQGRSHQWQKPDQLADRLCRHGAIPGGIAIDPFAGTGTFLAAAAKLGMHASGCELDPDQLDRCSARGIKR